MLMQISEVAIMKRALFYKLFLFLRLYLNYLFMRKVLFLLLPFIAAFVLKAQKPPAKFGDIPLEDMKMTVYPLDSSASAVVLVDFGESIINYNQSKGFQITFERLRRVKILTKEGLKWADFSI